MWHCPALAATRAVLRAAVHNRAVLRRRGTWYREKRPTGRTGRCTSAHGAENLAATPHLTAVLRDFLPGRYPWFASSQVSHTVATGYRFPKEPLRGTAQA